MTLCSLLNSKSRFKKSFSPISSLFSLRISVIKAAFQPSLIYSNFRFRPRIIKNTNMITNGKNEDKVNVEEALGNGEKAVDGAKAAEKAEDVAKAKSLKDLVKDSDETDKKTKTAKATRKISRRPKAAIGVKKDTTSTPKPSSNKRKQPEEENNEEDVIAVAEIQDEPNPAPEEQPRDVRSEHMVNNENAAVVPEDDSTKCSISNDVKNMIKEIINVLQKPNENEEGPGQPKLLKNNFVKF